MEHCKQEGIIASLQANISNLNGWQKRQNGNIDKINTTLQDIKKDIEDIKITLATPRGPSWAVATIMTVLSSICISLVVFVVTKMGGG